MSGIQQQTCNVAIKVDIHSIGGWVCVVTIIVGGQQNVDHQQETVGVLHMALHAKHEGIIVLQVQGAGTNTQQTTMWWICAVALECNNNGVMGVVPVTKHPFK
jgi:hypothetical protein